MIRRSQQGLLFYQFELLAGQPGLLHAVFTRLGGSSAPPYHTLNVGQLVGDNPQHVRANHHRIFNALSITQDAVVTARQVHGSSVAVVSEADRGGIMPSTDALVTESRDTYLLMRFADCLPLLMYDPARPAVALVHCGWRGVLGGVVHCAVQALRKSFGSQPDRISACLGPSIGPCCYAVGPEVVGRVRQVFGSQADALLPVRPSGQRHFDLPGAVRAQLVDLGLQHIDESHICTACHTEEFYSHRAEAGRTGRFAALVGLHTAP